MICFFLLTPLAVVSAYLCLWGAFLYFDEVYFEAIGLVFLAVFLTFIYFIWFGLTLR